MIEQLSAVVTEIGDSLLLWQNLSMELSWQGSQLKTIADFEAHKDLSSALKKLNNLPVISEEDMNSHTELRPAEYWLIDPIDGTASLASGFPGFVTQAALMKNDTPIISAIRAPALGHTYLAELGSGATCNGVKLNVKKKNNERIALIDNYPQPNGAAAELMQWLPCTNYVESGSISLKICRIADGTADIFFKDVIVRDWDIAAPYLIMTEAGGVITELDGKAYTFTGHLEKPGIIAARSCKLATRVKKFISQQTDRNPQPTTR